MNILQRIFGLKPSTPIIMPKRGFIKPHLYYSNGGWFCYSFADIRSSRGSRTSACPTPNAAWYIWHQMEKQRHDEEFYSIMTGKEVRYVR